MVRFLKFTKKNIYIYIYIYEKFEEFMERNFVQSLLVKYCLNASLFVICVLFKVI